MGENLETLRGMTTWLDLVGLSCRFVLVAYRGSDSCRWEEDDIKCLHST